MTLMVAGAAWQSYKYQQKKADEKAEERKKLDEIKANELKIHTEQIAYGLKNDQQQVARDLKENQQQIAKEVKDYTNEKNIEMVGKIDEIYKQLVEMVEGLAKRADLTNGNVRNIRSDIANMQEDIDELWVGNNNSNHQLGEVQSTEKNLTERKRQMRKRRQQIENDRIDQSEMEDKEAEPRRDRLTRKNKLA